MIDQWLLGHVLDRLADLADRSVHTCVTSPPYLGLRDYGTEPQEWPAVTFAPMPGLPTLTVPATRCCLGNEPDPWTYVGHLVVRRVLRDDGTLWLNLGDSAASIGGHTDTGCTDRRANGRVANRPEHTDRSRRLKAVGNGVKVKDILGIPWRVAFALQADGWYLRMDNVWHKPTPLPESVNDRTTRAHEYVFLLSKRRRYYYDAEAIREPDAGTPAGNGFAGRQGGERATAIDGGEGTREAWQPGGGRNKRSVWTITTQPYAAAHFATMPPALAEIGILAGSSAKGACSACGAPWARVTERAPRPGVGAKGVPVNERDGLTSEHGLERTGMSHFKYAEWLRENPRITVDWRPTCKHDADVDPCVVLDPFGGAGTTALVSRRTGRRFRHVELSADYLDLARRRVDGETWQARLAFAI